MNNYKLLHFNDIEKQDLYIHNNINHIIEIIVHCYPSNLKLFGKKTNNDKKEKQYIEILKNIVINSSKWAIWFFCIDEFTNYIIGFCFLYEQKLSYYKGNVNIDTYTIIKPCDKSFDIYENRKFKTIYPVIGGLCKDPKYTNVGAFIVNELISYLKSKTSYDKIFLVSESSLFRFNYLDYINENICVFNHEFFYSNKKLIKYYETLGFRVLKKTFNVNECIPITGDFAPDLYGDIICNNVLYKKIN
jgi:hypothetical protein